MKAHSYKPIVICFLITILFYITIVSAQPPVQFGKDVDGFTLRTNLLEVHGLDQNFTILAHVFNTSNGVPINSGISCYLHLSSSNGVQQADLQTNSPTGDFDYVFNVNNANFTENGEYAYVVQCNSSSQGGFIGNTFDVTPNGELPTTAKSIFYISLLALLVIFLLMIFWAHMQDQSELAKFWWFSFMWIPMWAILFIGWNMARDFLTSQGAIQSVLYYSWVIIGIVYPFFLLGLVLYTFYYIYKQKEVQNLINRGFSLEEAQGRVNGRGRGMDKW